jgi:pyrroloquinoline-quinone synthase
LDKHERTLQEIQQIHDENDKKRRDHPLITMLRNAELSREQMQEYIRQIGIIPLYNHLYHGRLYVVCPDPEWREMMAEVCYEEGTGRLFAGGQPHWKLYVRLGEALGITRKEMYATEYIPGALAWRAYYEYICGKSFLEGVSAHMLAGEAKVPEASKRIRQVLRDHYGLSEADVEFYTVHIHADAEHSDIGRRLLDKFASSDSDLALVIQTVRNTIGIEDLLFDDLYRHLRSFASTSNAVRH